MPSRQSLKENLQNPYQVGILFLCQWARFPSTSSLYFYI